MLLAIFLNNNGQETPKQAQDEHRDFLISMHKQGHVRIAGRLDNGLGLIICSAASKLEAEEMIKKDPFISGNYRTYEVHDWNLTVS